MKACSRAHLYVIAHKVNASERHGGGAGRFPVRVTAQANGYSVALQQHPMCSTVYTPRRIALVCKAASYRQSRHRGAEFIAEVRLAVQCSMATRSAAATSFDGCVAGAVLIAVGAAVAGNAAVVGTLRPLATSRRFFCSANTLLA